MEFGVMYLETFIGPLWSQTLTWGNKTQVSDSIKCLLHVSLEEFNEEN